MADNGRDTSLNSGADEAALNQDDPLFELARLMGEPAQAAPAEPVADAPVEAVAPDVAAPLSAADDLEAQLLAELGVGAPIADAPAPPPAPEPEPELAPVVETPAPAIMAAPAAPAAPTPRPSIEDELAALLDDKPAQPVTPAAVEPVVAPVEAVAPVVEQPERDEVGFDARDDSRDNASQPEVIEDALDTDLDDFMYVDFDAPSDDFEPAPIEPEADDVEFSDNETDTVDVVDNAVPGFDEPVELEVRDDVVTLENESAPVVDDDIDDADETAELDEAALFADFDNALDDEFDALFADDSMPSHEHNEEPVLDAFDAPDLSLDDVDASADNDAGMELGLGAAAAAIGAAGVAGLATVAAKGDDILDHIGLGKDNQSTALDELDQLMNPARAEKPAMPSVETTDIGALADEEFSDFDVPDLPVETAQLDTSSADNSAFDELDFDLDFDNEPAVAAASSVEEAAPFDGDDNGLIDDFEAELAKDMEFVSHNRAAPMSVDDDFFGEPEADDVAEQAEPPSQKRGFLVAGIVLGVALLGAVGVFALTGGGADPSTGPVVVEADPDPIKVQPEEPGGSAVPNQDLALFNGETEGGETQQEQLVTTSEEPVDIANAPGAALPSAVATKDDERLLPDDSIAAPNGDEAVTSVSPRRVRTLVVRSDGTLVEQPAEPAPVAQEPAIEVPALEAPAITETAPPVPAPDNGGVAFTPPATAPAAAPAPAPAPTQVPVRRVETQTITPPIIADRPNDQPVNIVNPQPVQQTQVAAAPQAVAPAAAPAPAPAASASPFVVQIASVPSREGAQQAATNLQQRFTNVLGGRGISIQQAQIDGRGTFYRVRVGAQSRDDANALCEQYKRAGGSCFVTR